MKMWQTYSDKFSAISQREQVLIFFSGLVLIVFGAFHLVLDSQLVQISQNKKQISQLSTTNKTTQNSINMLQQGLARDPNAVLRERISQYEYKLAKVDTELLALTSDLIDPVQMRHALVELLKIEKGVSLVSFQLVGAKPLALKQPEEETDKQTPVMNAEKTEQNNIAEPVETLALYKHGIKLKLTGSYFKLRDYLTQLEQLSWKFFWQEFDYQLKEYPVSELEIEIYSLSTKQEFIGV